MLSSFQFHLSIIITQLCCYMPISKLFYAPVKMNIMNHPHVSDRGPSDHTEDPYRQFFPTSLWHYSDTTNGRNIHLLGGVSDNQSRWQEGILNNKPFLHQNPWVSVSLGGGRIHFERCIRNVTQYLPSRSALSHRRSNSTIISTQ